MQSVKQETDEVAVPWTPGNRLDDEHLPDFELLSKSPLGALDDGGASERAEEGSAGFNYNIAMKCLHVLFRAPRERCARLVTRWRLFCGRRGCGRCEESSCSFLPGRPTCIKCHNAKKPCPAQSWLTIRILAVLFQISDDESKELFETYGRLMKTPKERTTETTSAITKVQVGGGGTPHREVVTYGKMGSCSRAPKRILNEDALPVKKRLRSLELSDTEIQENPVPAFHKVDDPSDEVERLQSELRREQEWRREAEEKKKVLEKVLFSQGDTLALNREEIQKLRQSEIQLKKLLEERNRLKTVDDANIKCIEGRLKFEVRLRGLAEAAMLEQHDAVEKLYKACAAALMGMRHMDDLPEVVAVARDEVANRLDNDLRGLRSLYARQLDPYAGVDLSEYPDYVWPLNRKSLKG